MKKMEVPILKNKKNGQMVLFLRKKELKVMGVSDPDAIRISKCNFITRGKNEKKAI